MTPSDTWRYAYCGAVDFSEITDGDFTMLKDNERNTCNSWSIDWTETRFEMADQKDKQVVCHITRPFVTLFSEIDLTQTASVPLTLGYNRWASRNSEQRLSGKAGEPFWLVLSDGARALAGGLGLLTLTLLN